METSSDLLARRAAVTPRGIPMVTSAVVTSGSGATLTDSDGNQLIDFAGGIGVMSVGHCQPSVVQAIQ
jgi:4-aminobutyrate aminotransferase / (S)-3-amino-2-methylpropionate transaminase / 5-aminovalerate transaminase